MPDRIELPAAYELCALDDTDDVMEDAWRRAAAGAPEGTLVWARSQRSGRTRRGRPRPSPRGNLYCALVLKPESDAERDPALALLALRACGAVVGQQAPPMADLRYRWPDAVLLNGCEVATITLEDAAAGQAGDALVLGVVINVQNHPLGLEPAATSLAAEGCSGATVEALLTAFCRHFAAWAERWGTEGVAPVCRSVEQRLAGLGGEVSISTAADTLAGTLVGLSPDGSMRLHTNDGERLIGIAEYFDLTRSPDR